ISTEQAGNHRGNQADGGYQLHSIRKPELMGAKQHHRTINTGLGYSRHTSCPAQQAMDTLLTEAQGKPVQQQRTGQATNDRTAKRRGQAPDTFICSNTNCHQNTVGRHDRHKALKNAKGQQTEYSVDGNPVDQGAQWVHLGPAFIRNTPVWLLALLLTYEQIPLFQSLLFLSSLASAQQP